MLDREPVVAVGLFRERGKIEGAIAALKEAGFSPSAIEVLVASPAATQEIAGGAPTGGAGAAHPEDAAGGLPAQTVQGKVGDVALGGGAGVVAASLTGYGFPHAVANRYEAEVVKGATVVVVNAHERYGDAERILREHGAQDAGEAAPGMPASG